MIELDLQIASSAKQLPSHAEFLVWCSLALRQRTNPSELTIRLVDAEEGLELNSTWRGKDYPTNVLSFPADIPEGLLDIPLLGDLVICVPVVEQEATEQSKTLTAHWAHLVMHGCLHLLGYDHTDKSDEQQMFKLQDDVLDDIISR